MDINSSALPKSEKLIIFTDEFALNFPTKSFRCTFCKRGFSNAQALGGHMNIHRKDRAKLREFSDENLLSLEISKNTDWEEDSSLGEKFSLENDRSPDGDQVESLTYPPRRLPSRPPVDGGEVSVGFLSKHADSRKEKLKYGELDLELRLGPEPHHSANSK